MGIENYTFNVIWSEEDAEYVGLCSAFPSLSYLAKTQEDALAGIQSVVAEVVLDLMADHT